MRIIDVIICKYNEFGETEWVKSPGPNSNYIYSHTAYDDIGRVEKTWTDNSETSEFDNGYNRSKPYFVTGSNRISHTSTWDDDGTEVSTHHKYDTLGRNYAACFESTRLDARIAKFNLLGW